MLTRPQLDLLRAVAAGNVAWRHHSRAGWAIRRTDLSSGGLGGELGRCVNHAIGRFAAAGLVKTVAKPATIGPDVPIPLAEPGQVLLDLSDLPRFAVDSAAAAPTLPMAQDGREPFLAGDENDAPSGAVIDLTDDYPDYPDMHGWWQRHGHQWVPVDPPHEDGS